MLMQNMENYLKTKQKLKVGLWMSTQEIKDLHTTGIWQAAVPSMPIRILLPNAEAMTKEIKPFYEGLSLPDHVIQRLLLARTHQDYLYTSPQGHRVFQCVLT